jgi:DNA-directed RNA polymerase subunit M/transcription elongation factor TFIIS
MNSYREKCTDIFSNFFKEKYEKNKIPTFKSYKKIAINIEKSIYNETIKNCKEYRRPLSWESHWFYNSYKHYYMKVISNLKLNPCAPKILQKLQNKEIKFRDIAGMTHKELDPELYWKRWKEYDLKRFPKPVDEEKVLGIKKKGMFKCGRCKSTNTYHTQSQRSSSDEPMTTLVSCNDCSNVWKFR